MDEHRQLGEFSIFANLGDDALAKVAAIATEENIKLGDHIFREGDHGDKLYLIARGEVRISKMVEGIGEEALAILKPGSYFGEMALIDDDTRSADAIAHTSAVLWVIRKDDFQRLLRENKDIAHDVLWTMVHTLTRRLRETNDKIKAFFAMSRF